MNMDHKITAEERLFFLTKPESSLPQLLNRFTQYREHSNFSINHSKYVYRNITLSHNTVVKVKQNYQFHWAPSAIKYLGTKITPNASPLYKVNFNALLAKIRSIHRKWHMLTLTWFGRCNAFKMKTSPKISYLIQAFSIWNDKVVQTRPALLTLPKKKEAWVSLTWHNTINFYIYPEWRHGVLLRNPNYGLRLNNTPLPSPSLPFPGQWLNIYQKDTSPPLAPQ